MLSTLDFSVFLGQKGAGMSSRSNGKKSSPTPKSKRPDAIPKLSQLTPAATMAQLQAKTIPGDPGPEEMLRRIRQLQNGDKKVQVTIVPDGNRKVASAMCQVTGPGSHFWSHLRWQQCRVPL
jgi:hypothetical protein